MGNEAQLQKCKTQTGYKIRPLIVWRDKSRLKTRARSVTAVEVSTRELVDRTLLRTNDTICADRALSEGLSDSTATVAETELVAADTDNGTILGARRAVGA
jgi:hypothetical protein